MIGKIFRGVTNVLKAATGLVNALKSFMQSPFGNLLAAVFPPAGLMLGSMNFLNMFNSLGSGIGGRFNY
jgi:hypothetical protein